MKNQNNEIETEGFLTVYDLDALVDTIFGYINGDENKIRHSILRSTFDDKQEKMSDAAKIARDGVGRLVDKLNLESRRELDNLKWRITMLEEKLKDKK